MLPPSETWMVFGDAYLKSILTAVSNHDEYQNAATQFHTRLFLVVCGLAIEELRDMFGAALPPYLNSTSSEKRCKISRIFKKYHGLFQDRMVARI